MSAPAPATPARLLLIDASSFLYRAYHALPDLRSRSGHPTGAITGMVNMLRRVQADYPASHVGCVFDPRGPTFREEIYPDYKANRGTMPEDLEAQVPAIFEAVRALGWPLIQIPGVEADDVIGTLAQQAHARGLEVLIATGDKDMAQLVHDGVRLVDTMAREGSAVRISGPAEVFEKFGVRPDQIIDYLTLVGDTSDNVPGVPKVGPKTAAKWLAEHHTLDGLVAAAASVSGVVGQNLRDAIAGGFLPTAKVLVTIKTDVDLSGAVAEMDVCLRMGPLQPEVLERLRREYDLDRTLKGLTDASASSATLGAAGRTGSNSSPSDLAERTGHGDLPAPPTDIHYATIDTPAALAALASSLLSAELAAFDTETTSLDARHAQLVGLSFSWAPGQAAYVPVGHAYAGAPAQLGWPEVAEALRPWFESEAHAKLAQNMKYDLHVLRAAGMEVRGPIHDTLLQSYVLEAHKSHDLGSLAERHLGRRGLSYDDVTGKGVGRIGFEQVDVAVATQYSCEDSDFTLCVHQTLWPQIEADAKLREIYTEIEIPSLRVLFEMETQGIRIDSALLEAQTHELGAQIDALERQAHALAGQPFNLGSPKQLGEILFDRLGYPPVKKTAKGAPSTDEDVLETLAQNYPLPKVLLEWRSLSKLKSTYTEKLPRMVDVRTGRIHTTFSQAVAITGRLASSDPNLQNIPIRTAEGRRIRKAFVAPPGHLLVSADYSQIELRIMAHLSGDEGLCSAFLSGKDVHRATAAEIFGVPTDAVDDDQRRTAKVINFGLIYGMSAFGLAQNLGIDRGAAAGYIERYFARYPGVAAYMERIKAEARQRGYVETVFGRRLWLPDIAGANGPRRAAAERVAINAPMQGTAADLIKRAMVQLHRAIEQERLPAKMLLQVHDELIFEVPEAALAEVAARVTSVMEGAGQLAVPLLVSVGSGPNWDDAH